MNAHQIKALVLEALRAHLRDAPMTHVYEDENSNAIVEIMGERFIVMVGRFLHDDPTGRKPHEQH